MIILNLLHRVNITSFVFFPQKPTNQHFSLTQYIEAADFGHHRARVDLAHVTSLVALFQLTNVQLPRAVDELFLAASGDAVTTGIADGARVSSSAFVAHR